MTLTRRRMMGGTLAAIVTACFAPTALAIERNGSGFSSRYDTIGHVFLDAEQQQGFEVTQENYDFLDSVIHKIRARYKVELAKPDRVHLDTRMGRDGTESAFSSKLMESYNLEDIEKIMGWIDESLSEIFNVVYRENNRLGAAFTKHEEGEIVEYLRDEGNAQRIIDFEGDEFTEASEEVNDFINRNILHTQSSGGYFTSLSEHRRGSREKKIRRYREGFYQMDCDNMSMIYLSIAEALDFPIEGVLGPEHMYTLWNKFGGGKVNWETTAGVTRSDEEYIKDSGLSKEKLLAGGYLRSLNRTELTGILYENLGLEWIDRTGSAESEDEKEQCMRRASECLDTAVSLFPGCMLIHHNSLIARKNVGDWEGVIDDGSYLLDFNPNDHDNRFNVAYANGELGNSEEALRDYQVLIKAREEVKENTLVATYRNASNAARNLEEYDLALEYRLEHLELRPNDHGSRVSLAQCYENIGDLEESLRQCQLVIKEKDDIEDDNTLVRAYSQAASVAGDLEEYDLAIEYRRKQLELVPDNHGARASLGYVYLKKGDNEKSLKQYQLVIKAKDEIEESTLENSYNNAAVVCLRMERFDLVIEYRRKQLEILPDEHDARAALGYAYLETGDNQNAFEQYSIVIDNSSSISDELLARCYNNRGCALQRMDRREEADRDFAKSKKLKE